MPDSPYARSAPPPPPGPPEAPADDSGDTIRVEMDRPVVTGTAAGRVFEDTAAGSASGRVFGDTDTDADVRTPPEGIPSLAGYHPPPRTTTHLDGGPVLAGPNRPITGASAPNVLRRPGRGPRRANLQIKRNALSRQAALLKRGFTTRADYEDALNEVRTAETALADAQARAANAHAALSPGEQPSIAQAQAAVDKARLDLSRTEVRAPMDGTIANADRLQVGQMAVEGVGMLSLVHNQDAWVEANFKEKDVGKMIPGQRATIEIDAYPGTVFEAHVQSIGAGTGSEFAIIPAQNANGNWVKVTQRVPVRIAFDGHPDKPLIAGLSSDVTVYLGD